LSIIFVCSAFKAYRLNTIFYFAAERQDDMAKYAHICIRRHLTYKWINSLINVDARIVLFYSQMLLQLIVNNFEVTI